MDGELNAIYGVVGLVVVKEVGAGIISAARWFAARAMAREEASKQAEAEQVENLEKLVREIVPRLERAVETTSYTKGIVEELKSGIDERFDEQSKFYREELVKVAQVFTKQLTDLEYQLRRDMTRAISDQAPTLRPAKKKR